MALNDYHIAKDFQSVLIRQREELEIGSAIVFPPCEGLLNSWSTPTKRAGSKRTSPLSLVMQNQEATDSFVPALTTAFSGLFLVWGCTPMKLRIIPYYGVNSLISGQLRFPVQSRHWFRSIP